MKPTITVVADTYYPKIDGTIIFMEEFVKRVKGSMEISLLVPKLGSKKNPLGKNVTFIEPSKRISVSGYPNLKLTLKNWRTIKKKVKESEVLFIQGPALISYVAMYYGHKFRTKMVFYTHTISWELFEKFFPPILNRFFFNVIKRFSIFLYNNCTSIFVPYAELRKHLSKQGVKAPMEIAPLGVDISRFYPIEDKNKWKKKLSIPRDTFVVGYVGRISKEKNVQLLLKAFLKLKNQKKVHLLIVGDGPDDQLKDFKSLSNCTVTGFVRNVPDYLAAMDTFVMPSLTETTSLATLEAMSAGLPVIVSKVGYMKQYVVKGYNGAFCPRNSASMLAVKIEKLRSDDELRTKLGKNARRTAAYGYSWERSINRIKKKLMDLYHQK